MSFSIKPKSEDNAPQEPTGGAGAQPPVITRTKSSNATAILALGLVACLGLLGLVAYNAYASGQQFEQRIAALESQLRDEIKVVRNEGNRLAGELEVVGQKVGINEQELQAARRYAERLRQEQEAADQKLASELAKKAATTDVAAVRDETTSKLAEVQQTTDTKIGTVSGEVKTVAQDLTATKQDLAQSKRDLIDVRNTLSAQIARNSSELGELRKKGERDYFEFDIRKGRKNVGQRVADIGLELKKADAKKQKYDVVIMVDDSRLEKKDRTANEPVQFLVGRDKLRYEVVVNVVDKDRIRGYVSAPKDKVLSAEKPAFRSQQ